MAILYVASEAAELRPFASLLTGLRKLKWPVDYAFEGILGSRRILLAANGAGPRLASHVVEIAIRAGMVAELSSSRLEAVVSTGYCGALEPALSEHQIVVASEIISAADGEHIHCATVEADSPFVQGPILSQDRVAGTLEEKQQLASQGAIAVDMESSGVAARTRRAGLPVCCIKVISDRAQESFPFDLNRMRTAEGRIARGKIIRHAAGHPNLVPALFRLRRRAADAATALGEFLVSCRIITESNIGEPNRGDSSSS